MTTSPKEYNNFKIPGTGNDIYGKKRLEMAVYFRDNILTKINNDSFIENGTLLGAWRNNEFIKHDDDFDFAMLINNKEKIHEIYKFIRENLSKKYECRLISSYSHKLEIYDPKQGNYLLPEQYSGANYHYVTIDLQFYLRKNENNYEAMFNINPFTTIVDIRTILPLRKIILENEIFMAPFKTRKFLENNYGSLHSNAKYNKETGKYHC